MSTAVFGCKFVRPLPNCRNATTQPAYSYCKFLPLTSSSSKQGVLVKRTSDRHNWLLRGVTFVIGPTDYGSLRSVRSFWTSPTSQPEHTEPQPKYRKNAPIFSSRWLQLYYNPKAPYLPISRKYPSRKTLSIKDLQKHQNLAPDSMTGARKEELTASSSYQPP